MIAQESHPLASSVELPLMILDERALTHNITAMAAWVDRLGLQIAPHAKTSLSAEVVRRQLTSHPWGMTAANVAQARGLLAVGASRVIIANQVADIRSVRELGRLLDLEKSEVYCFVDSHLGLAFLEEHLPQRAKQLPVFVEHGYVGGRSGTRSLDELVDLAEAVSSSRHLKLVGVSGYEGQLPLKGAATPPGLRPYLREIKVGLARMVSAGLFSDEGAIVSAGGSAFFDIVAEELSPHRFDSDVPVVTVLRSGCYVTHDHGLYARTSPGSDGRSIVGAPSFFPALELLAPVLSTPEPGLAIVGFGRRHAPIDDTLPVLVRVPSLVDQESATACRVVRLNDQHAYLANPRHAPLKPGDVLGFGVSHPCGAFDRWRSMPMVAADGSIIETIHTSLEQPRWRSSDEFASTR